MIIKDKNLGDCDLVICIKKSIVDSFAESGYSISKKRRLTDDEIERINKDFEDKIQMWCYSEGGAIYHN